MTTFPTKLLMCSVFTQVLLMPFSEVDCAEDTVKKAQVTFYLWLSLGSAKVDTLLMAKLKKVQYYSTGYSASDCSVSLLVGDKLTGFEALLQN